MSKNELGVWETAVTISKAFKLLKLFFLGVWPLGFDGCKPCERLH